MIESGSHTPGISVEAFELPPNTALRYEHPDPRLARYITDYHVLDSIEIDAGGVVEWMLPSWAAIRIVLADDPITIRLGNRIYDPVPTASLYGVTSRALEISTLGGVTVGAGLTPMGWARMLRTSADMFRDRITPLDELLPCEVVDTLVASLRASDRGPAVKGILDEFFLRQMGPPHPDEPLIEQINGLILDPDITNLTTAAAAIGINEPHLRRLSKRHFGFPPKTLLMRTRFLRSMVALIRHGAPADYSALGDDYHDTSHFLRDAGRFLGMTPRRFMAMKTPYLDAALRARAQVFGASMMALHDDGLKDGKP